MAEAVQIDCINKDPRMDPHERIRRVGGPNADGSRWNLPIDDAIEGATSGKWNFYVHTGGTLVWVVVQTGPSGRKYLKTENDGYTPDNLLSLPECG